MEETILLDQRFTNHSSSLIERHKLLLARTKLTSKKRHLYCTCPVDCKSHCTFGWGCEKKCKLPTWATSSKQFTAVHQQTQSTSEILPDDEGWTPRITLNQFVLEKGGLLGYSRPSTVCRLCFFVYFKMGWFLCVYCIILEKSFRQKKEVKLNDKLMIKKYK